MANNVKLPDGFKVVYRPALMQDDKEKQVTQTRGERALDSLKHDLQDIAYGAKKALSGETLGASDWVLRKMGVTDDGYLNKREAEGLGPIVKGSGILSETGGNVLGAGGLILKGAEKLGLRGLKALIAGGTVEGAGYGITSSDKLQDLPQNIAINSAIGATAPIAFHYGLKPLAAALSPITNRVEQLVGKNRLISELRKGKDYSDVKLGNVTDDVATQLNAVRNSENVSPVRSSKVVIPADRVDHIRVQRILGDKYTPKKTANVVDNALFSKNTKIIKGNEPQLQIAYDAQDPANAAIIGKHRDTGDIFVKTSMNKNKRALDGRSFPSYTVDAKAPSPQHLRISDFQSSTSNVAPNFDNVKQIDTKSFVEGLADEKSRRKMRNAVMAGAEDLSDRAKIIGDKLERRSNGAIDPDFENLIKTSELKEAEKKYAEFMSKNGKQKIPPEKVNEFYEKNPIAQDMIDEAREIAPQKFGGIERGSLAEFDKLKRMLRKMKGNQSEKTVKQEAAEIAEKDLKTIMDNEFAGFRDVNKKFADASTTQDIFESKLKKGITSVGGATISPFWSGFSSPIAAAGVVGGAFHPLPAALALAGLGGKALMRYSRKNAGRNIANGVIKTPANISPLLNIGLTGASLNNINDFERKEKQIMIDLLTGNK